LKRVFFLSASPETVRRTLQEESFIVPSRKKRSTNITRPRFFERSTPNQLWQGDIFTFRLGGRYAYLVGMVDDYSRYMVGLELYRSKTADQVIEVYRRAVGEYGVPKEVLTDRGGQLNSPEYYAHDLNHRLRPCLHGKTSCQVFFSLGERPVFSKLERREIYDILMGRVERILASMNQFGKSTRESTWRIAVEFWLPSKGFIKVHIPKKGSPNFTSIFSS